jgi:hypothetical protein
MCLLHGFMSSLSKKQRGKAATLDVWTLSIVYHSKKNMFQKLGALETSVSGPVNEGNCGPKPT